MNIITFENSWRNNSWAKHLSSKDQTPVFWTKETTKNNDVMDQAFAAYDAEYPGRSVRIDYETYDTLEKVEAAWKKFLKANKDAPVLHLWTQGTLEGKGPGAMAQYLRNIR